MSTILLWAWTPNELLSRSYNSHHHLFSFFLHEGKKKANQPQTTTTIGPGGCPHGLMETRPPPHGRQTTGEEYQRRLPALQVSLFANFLMCPPTCLRGITSCLPPHPQPHNFPRRPACVRPKPDSGRGPGAWGRGYQEPRPSELAAPGAGGCLRGGQVLPRPPARPPPGPARPRLPRFTSLKLWDFLLRFLSENSMVRRAGRAGAAAGRRDRGSGG